MNKQELIIEKSEYTTKKGLCDIKGCTSGKGDFYAMETKDQANTKYDDVLFLCKRHSKMIKVKKQ